ncbi:MAG: VanZ family protein [Calditrichaeota bacterium]|nr:MAG: VanZ family protein [Calditrichota bacterium]
MVFTLLDDDKILPVYQWFREKWSSLLVWGYTLFILYVTFSPFKFARDTAKILKNFQHVEWVPYIFKGNFYSGSDIFLNILLFFILGVLVGGRRILQSYQKFQLKDWWSVIRFGLFLSLVVEVLQNFTWDRDSSASDLFNNILGTILGAWFIHFIYLRYRGIIKQWLLNIFSGKPEMVLSAFWLGILFMGSLAPYNFYLSTYHIARRFSSFMTHPFTIEGDYWGEAIIYFLLYSLFSFFFLRGVLFYFPRLLNRRYRWLIFLLLIATVGFLEAIQLGLKERRHSLSDLIPGLVGIAVGIYYGYIKTVGKLRNTKAFKGDGSLYRMDRQHFTFIRFIAIIFFTRLFLNEAVLLLEGKFVNIQSKLLYFFHPYRWLFEGDRLGMVTDVLRLGILMFFLAFFMSVLLRTKLTHRWNPRYVWYAGIFYLILTLIVSMMFSADKPHILQMMGGLVGLWVGLFFEFIYHQMFTTEARRNPAPEYSPTECMGKINVDIKKS